MKLDGFYRALSRAGITKKDGCGKPYLKNVTEVLQEQVEFCRKDDITVRPERRNVFKSSLLNYDYGVHLKCYREVKKKVMGSRDSRNV